MADARQRTTEFVNQAEPLLVANRDTFFLAPSVEAQVLALAEFDRTWLELASLCDASMGAAGVDCLADRSRGGRWDWYSYYRDPISSWQPSGASASTDLQTQVNAPSGGVPAPTGGTNGAAGTGPAAPHALTTNNELLIWAGVGIGAVLLVSRWLK